MISPKNSHQNIARKETKGKVCGSFVMEEVFQKKAGFRPLSFGKITKVDTAREKNIFCPFCLRRKE